MKIEAGAPVVAYVRVSTREQEGNSPETQREFISQYAEQHRLVILEWFEETQSGWLRGKPRDEFERMDAFLYTHPEVEAVLVYRLDRLARNDPDFARHLSQTDYRIISVTEDFPDSPAGRMGLRVTAAVAIGFSEGLSELVKDGQGTKAMRGAFPGGGRRLGYVFEDGSLKPEPEQAAIVRELFDVFEQPEMTLKRLAKYAKDRGFRTVTGKWFAVSSLWYVLRNPLYYGAFRWKKEVYEGIHEPLVSRAQFERVQKKLNRNTASVEPNRFPYRGVLFCNLCGCKITGLFKKGRYTYYRCTGGKGDCAVVHKNVPQDVMGNRLAQVIDDVHLTEEQVSFLLRTRDTILKDRTNHTKLEIGKLKSTLEEIEADRIKAYTDKMHGTVEEEFWRQVDTGLQRRRQVVGKRIEALQKQQLGDLGDPRPALELLEAAPELYKRATHIQRARILKALVWNCEVDTENVYPNYKQPYATVAQAKANSDLSGGLNVERVR